MKQIYNKLMWWRTNSNNHSTTFVMTVINTSSDLFDKVLDTNNMISERIIISIRQNINT